MSTPAADPRIGTPVEVDYDVLERDFVALLGSERDRIANAANAAALLFHRLADVSWVGFYLTRPGTGGAAPELVLGPFQGKPACVRIAWGRGVCGTAAASRRTQRVDDVHAFDGHIACDPQSRSELVVPLLDRAGEVAGVLDLDSTRPGRFAAADAAGMERLAAAFMRAWDAGD